MTDVRLVATNPDDGLLVPVASNASGQLAVQSPKIEKVPNDLDVEGTVTATKFIGGSGEFAGKINLNADGSADFSDGAVDVSVSGTVSVRNLFNASPDNSFPCFAGRNYSGSTTSQIYGNGSVQFDGSATIGDNTAWNDATNRSSCYLTSAGSIELYNINPPSSSNYLITGYARGTKTFELKTNGSADFVGRVSSDEYFTADRDIDAPTAALYLGFHKGVEKFKVGVDGSGDFSGDVVIGSRGSKWLIRESNGVAMLVEQGFRGTNEPRIKDEEVKVRDLPRELDLVEAALNEIMEKLRMTPPAGWPVWDGSDNLA